MRVNLYTRAAVGSQGLKGGVPLTLMIRPACGLPGDFEYKTDISAVLRMLRRQTDLPDTVITRFEKTVAASGVARLLAVDLNESVLTEIGYFID